MTRADMTGGTGAGAGSGAGAGAAGAGAGAGAGAAGGAGAFNASSTDGSDRGPQAFEAFDAIVLAGGRGSRLGGADKAAQLLAGERLVDRTVAAARAAGAHRVVVVGPEAAGAAADAVVRERPAFGGPLAALAAGATAVDARWVWVLACDLEHPDRVCAELAAGAPYAADGLLLLDDAGRPQWLAGCYRRQALVDACDALGEGVSGAPVRRALERLELRGRTISSASAADIDTPEALAQAQARAGARARRPGRPVDPCDGVQ